jgi:peptidyl-tRNA hydrolase
VDWVLSRFGDSDRGLVDEALVRAEEVVDVWLREGVAVAMNRCNAPEST